MIPCCGVGQGGNRAAKPRTLRLQEACDNILLLIEDDDSARSSAADRLPVRYALVSGKCNPVWLKIYAKPGCSPC